MAENKESKERHSEENDEVRNTNPYAGAYGGTLYDDQPYQGAYGYGADAYPGMSMTGYETPQMTGGMGTVPPAYGPYGQGAGWPAYQEPYPGVPQPAGTMGGSMAQPYYAPPLQPYIGQPQPYMGPETPQLIEPGAPGAEMLPLQQSYIENILRLNKGKIATVYQTFENNEEWNAKVFRGRIEAAGRDHIILSDLETDTRYLLLMIYVDYITFEGPIEYAYPAEYFQL